MNIVDVSAAWIAYRAAFRRMAREPKEIRYQYQTAVAYAKLVMIQAQYSSEIKSV